MPSPVVDVARYLQRIGLQGAEPQPDLAWLRRLQLAHLLAVPFENLHVFHRVGPTVDLAWSYPKIVEHGRGGWCFELNGCFSALLRALGYDVDLISCRVWSPSIGDLGPPLDHLALVAHLAGGDHLVDVGFGDSPLTPLPLAESGWQPVAPRPARVERESGTLRLWEREPDGQELLQYEADLTPRRLDEFASRSAELQADGSTWRAKRFATKATSAQGARVWLLSDRLKQRDDAGAVHEEPVEPDRWEGVLLDRFGLTVPAPVQR